jgi:hypothetical protein
MPKEEFNPGPSKMPTPEQIQEIFWKNKDQNQYLSGDGEDDESEYRDSEKSKIDQDPYGEED